MSPKEQLKIGEVIPGTPYRVMRLLGSGGMGSVYEVEHQELGKHFVLKTLLSELSNRADLVQRLRTEWRSLGKLEHPNIVRVSDAGVANGKLPYFVMERLIGETLSDRLARQSLVPVGEAIEIAVALLEALSVAHHIGIIHRDVKPPNIFLTQQGVPKLLDFGIAKLLDASAESITARGVAVGTPRYMSPEQAAGDPIDARADLYAVGLVLYEMVSGSGPYRAADANELFLAHLTQPAPVLSTQARNVSLELDAVVASLLAKAPAERPNGAKAAADALRAALSSYQKQGATPLAHGGASVAPVAANAPHGSVGKQAVPSAPVTVALGEAPTVTHDMLEKFAATTKRLPAAQSHSTNLKVTFDERALRKRPPQQLPETAGNTVRISQPAEPAAGSVWGPPTHTRAAPGSIVVEAPGTPPPVARNAGAERYRRWLFPVAVVGLAILAISLSRTGRDRSASAPALPKVAAQSASESAVSEPAASESAARAAPESGARATPEMPLSATPAAAVPSAPLGSAAVPPALPRKLAPPVAPARLAKAPATAAPRAKPPSAQPLTNLPKIPQAEPSRLAPSHRPLPPSGL